MTLVGLLMFVACPEFMPKHFGDLCPDFHLQEMRKLLQTFKAPEAPPPRRAGRRNDRGVHAKPVRELSVLRWGPQLFCTFLASPEGWWETFLWDLQLRWR